MVALVFCGEEGGGGGGRGGAVAARGSRGVGAGAEDGEAVGEREEDGLRDGDEGEEDHAEALPQRQRALRPLLSPHRRNHETQRKISRNGLQERIAIATTTHHVVGGESEAEARVHGERGRRPCQLCSRRRGSRVNWKSQRRPCRPGGSCRSCTALRAHWPVKQNRGQ